MYTLQLCYSNFYKLNKDIYNLHNILVTIILTPDILCFKSS